MNSNDAELYRILLTLSKRINALETQLGEAYIGVMYLLENIKPEALKNNTSTRNVIINSIDTNISEKINRLEKEIKKINEDANI